MTTVAELQIILETDGEAEVAADLNEAQQNLDDTAKSAEKTADKLNSFSKLWAGALTVIVAAIGTTLGSMLIKMPLMNELVGAFNVLLSSLAFMFDEVLRPVLQPVIDLIFKLSEKIDSLDAKTKKVVVIGWILIGFFSSLLIAILSIIATLVILKKAWDENFLGMRDIITTVLDTIKTTLGTGLDFIKGLFTPVLDSITSAWDTAFGGIKTTIETIFSGMVTFLDLIFNGVGGIKSIIGLAISGIVTVIETALGILSTMWDTAFGGIKTTIGTIFSGMVTFLDLIFNGVGGIKSIIGLAISGIVTVIETALGILSTMWDTIWGGLSTAAETVFDTVKTLWGTLGDIIKGVLNALIGAINVGIDSINKIKVTIPDWVPVVGGESWSLDIPNIPTLDTGGKVLETGIAKVHKDERFFPPSRMNDLAREAGGSNQPIVIPVYLDGKKIAENTAQHLSFPVNVKGAKS